MKSSILLIIALMAAGVYPTASMSRWFTASFYDLKLTLHRYGRCIGNSSPLRDYSLNETDFLIYHLNTFIDQGNYDPVQLTNVTALMDEICRTPKADNQEQTYPISFYIDVNKYGNNHTEGKLNRCRAIDEALDSMFYVFKRAALNHSEPLDFSVIQFYPDPSNRTMSYNVTDLINTSWIKSDTILEHVCNITDAVKQHVQTKIAASFNSTSSAFSANATLSNKADKRNEQQTRIGVIWGISKAIERILDTLFGFQKRIMYDTIMMPSRLSTGLSNAREGFGNRIKSARDRVSNLFTSNSKSNSTATNIPLNTTNGMSLNSTLFNATALSGPVATTPGFSVMPTTQKSLTSSTTAAPSVGATGVNNNKTANPLGNSKPTASSPIVANIN